MGRNLQIGYLASSRPGEKVREVSELNQDE
jgi:hypothetical protein